MQFDSLTYAVFLWLNFVIYWALPRRWQNAQLLLASYVFYGWWDWRFLGLIVISSAVDYSMGLAIHDSQEPGRRRVYLGISLAANLGLLGLFKYYDFFVSSLKSLFAEMGMTVGLDSLGLILPVGISFYTFQTMSYTLDIYREKMEPTRDFVAFLAFVAFFPQLVAGPIERAKSLLPQFLDDRTFDGERANEGLRYILYGLFLKLVVANNLAQAVDTVYANETANGWMYWLATYQFAFQIYGDFAGYSYVAIGSARLFGITLSKNFAYPYISASITEFWTRWHISLSTWFRDYVYIPLGGNRVSKRRNYANLMTTFLVSGLWHGANWTFVVWGFLHGLLASVHKAMGGREGKGWIGRVITFHLVCLAWVYFRAPNLASANHIVKTMTWTLCRYSNWNPLAAGNVVESCLAVFFTPVAIASLAMMAGLIALEWNSRDKDFPLEGIRRPGVHWPLCYLLGMTILLFGYVGRVPFIYFQF